MIRRRIKDRRTPLDEKGLRVEEQEDTPAGRFDEHELVVWFRSALAKLNPRAAPVFVLRCIEGCSNQEVAELLKHRKARLPSLFTAPVPTCRRNSKRSSEGDNDVGQKNSRRTFGKGD